MSKRIIVTGGAGFIGSAMVRHIINETNDAVCVVDKLTYAGNLDSLEPVAGSDRYTFEKADICDKAAMDRIFSEFRPTNVMHLAAESHVGCRKLNKKSFFSITYPPTKFMAI